MLIGLCGGICTGKQTAAEFLVKQCGFTPIYLKRSIATPAVERSALDLPLPQSQPSYEIAPSHSFENANAMLEFVTHNWRERWVLPAIWDEDVLDQLFIKPFFLLVSIDAPVSIRWKRFRSRCLAQSVPAPSLEEFVLRSDEQSYNPESGLAHLVGRAQLRLLNQSDSLNDLHTSLHSIDLTNELRLRPSWDQYFMQLASLAAQRSNCMKRRVGCVLVREKRVISTGYNGTPRNLTNCNAGGCPRCNQGAGQGSSLSTCLCLHAEENALLEAGRERIREGSILYCDTCPCLTCSVKITQVGISEVVYSQNYHMDKQTVEVFREAGIRLRQFSPPRNGLIDLVSIVRGET